MHRVKHIGLHALPTVSIKQAAAFWNMGSEKWKRTLMEDLSRAGVRCFRNEHEWRFVLVDIIHVAFPDAKEISIHMMALQYLETRWQARIDARRASRSRGD